MVKKYELEFWEIDKIPPMTNLNLKNKRELAGFE